MAHEKPPLFIDQAAKEHKPRPWHKAVDFKNIFASRAPFFESLWAHEPI
jgi:hypothetical protein